jgi:hypothetical protein
MNDLVNLNRYDPSARSSPLDILGHAFFDDLRRQAAAAPQSGAELCVCWLSRFCSEAFHWRSNTPLPPLFDFLPDGTCVRDCEAEQDVLAVAGIADACRGAD